jgi:mxaD protein
MNMPHVEATAEVPVAADALWREIGSFQGVGRWHPMLKKVEGEGEQPGSIRIPESASGKKNVERLREINPGQRFMRYEILSSPLPIKDFVVELSVADNGDGTSTVVWGGDFLVTSADEAKIVETIHGFLAAGLENLKQKYRQ